MQYWPSSPAALDVVANKDTNWWQKNLQFSFFPPLPAWKKETTESKDINTGKIIHLNKGLVLIDLGWIFRIAAKMPAVAIPLPGLSPGGCGSTGGTVGLSPGAEGQPGPDSWSHTLSGRNQAGNMANFTSSCGFCLQRPCPQPWWRRYQIDSAPPLFSVTMTMPYSRSRKALQNRAVGKCIALALGQMCPKIMQLAV